MFKSLVKPRWTNKEISFLKNNFETLFLREMLELDIFKNRTLKALKDKANRLGLKRNRKGNKNPNYKKGYFISNGYKILTNKYNCPYANNRGRIKESVYVWWKYHGDKQPILKDEIIHHKNGNRIDNRIENLQKMTKSQHTSLHNIGNKYSHKNYKKTRS